MKGSSINLEGTYEKTRKILIFGVALLGLFNFISCYDGNTNENSYCITQTELEDTLNDTVQNYFNEKYGVLVYNI